MGIGAREWDEFAIFERALEWVLTIARAEFDCFIGLEIDFLALFFCFTNGTISLLSFLFLFTLRFQNPEFRKIRLLFLWSFLWLLINFKGNILPYSQW